MDMDVGNMPEINIDVDYFDHPKTQLLCEDLGGDWAEIMPIRLWRYTARFHADTGIITTQSARLVERHLKWKGERGTLIAKFVEYGFLEPIENGYVVHDFLKRNGHIAKFSKRGKTAADLRWAKDANRLPKQCINGKQALHSDDPSNARAYEASEAHDVSERGEPPKPVSAFQAWLMRLGRARISADDDRFIDELLRQGWTDETLTKAIMDPSRERDQAPWAFKKWLKDSYRRSESRANTPEEIARMTDS